MSTNRMGTQGSGIHRRDDIVAGMPDSRFEAPKQPDRPPPAGPTNIIGKSPALVAELAKIPAAAAHDVDVLIRGETGTGKELFARAIHDRSKRHAHPWVALNCGTVPGELFENELFGHAPGAYTGANRKASGLVDQARGGTLFLDEVDALALPAQVKLLRLLQNREYRALGAQRAQLADVRLIAASNADLELAVQAGRFRPDLYHRLAVFEFNLPPLRERPGDIELLAEHFLSELAGKIGKQPCRLLDCARQKLLSHHWPGNIRELENALTRAVLSSNGNLIFSVDLQIKPGRGSDAETDFEFSWSKAREVFEKDYLTRLMQLSHGDTSQAARASGLHRRTLQRLLRKHRVLS